LLHIKSFSKKYKFSHMKPSISYSWYSEVEIRSLRRSSSAIEGDNDSTSPLLGARVVENHRWEVALGSSRVPRVEKKPTATPFSPLLGARRNREILLSQSQALAPHFENNDIGTTTMAFRARPALPHFVGQSGVGGSLSFQRLCHRPAVSALGPST
jgi:hypothetical protein